MDLEGRDKGNISLPARLQSYPPDDEETQERPKDKPTIINTQRAHYNIRIQDIGNRIERLEKRNEELLEEIDVVNEDSGAIDASTAEEIATLTKQVFSQDAVVIGLKERIETLESNRIKDAETMEEKIQLFNEKYKKKKVDLVSQIKVLTAKINILEDFKKAQTALEEKYKANEEKIRQNEENVNEILEITRRKIEFDKEMLKNEMYECLLGLAAEFQLETAKHISLPNQRLMRENVMLKNELQQITEAAIFQTDTQINLKNSIVEHKIGIKSQSSIAKHSTIMSKVQNDILNRLKRRYESMRQLFLTIDIPDATAETRCVLMLESVQREHDIINCRLSSMKTLLHKDRAKVNVAEYLLKRLECKIKAAVETIYDLKYTVICLLKRPSSRRDLQKLTCIQLFLFLREILVKGESKLRSFLVKSLESIPRVLDPELDLREIHEPFDLEFTPEPSEKSLLTDIIDKVEEDKEVEEHRKESTESSEELEEEAIVSDEAASIHSALDEDYEREEGEEMEGEYDETDE